jgi:hypothetical protein
MVAGEAPVVGKVPPPPVLAESVHPDNVPVASIVPVSDVHFTALAAAAGLAADADDVRATVAIDAGINKAAGTRRTLVSRVRNIYLPPMGSSVLLGMCGGPVRTDPALLLPRACGSLT